MHFRGAALPMICVLFACTRSVPDAVQSAPPQEQRRVESPSPQTPAAPAPAAPVPPKIDFAAEIRPILEQRCQPCHFPGGKVYDRLPFDRPETIVKLGTKLFTRIKDEGQQAIIRRFLAQQPSNGVRLTPR